MNLLVVFCLFSCLFVHSKNAPLVETLNRPWFVRHFQVKLVTLKTETNNFIYLDCHQGFLKPRMKKSHNRKEKTDIDLFCTIRTI